MRGVEASEVLIQRAVRGDRAALTELLEQHGPVLRDRFRPQIPKRWQSVLSLDDLMQETYTDAFLEIGEFSPQGENSFERWLSTIARHNLLNAIRMLEAEKRGGKRQRVGLHGNDESGTALYELLGFTSSTPGGRAQRAEAGISLLSAVERLPECYRRVVQMIDIEGREVSDAASVLGRTPGAVYMLRARAHRTLKKLLGGSSPSPGSFP